MSSTTHNLPYKRFVAQVSTGVARSKSTWLALMNENLEALKACPWREAADVEVALTPHDFTLPSYFSDIYDAYKMTGSYNSSNMTEIGYAGMAAYRFTVPSDATTNSVALSSVALPISRDRFLKGGIRLAAVLSADEEPSSVWSVVRGDGEGALVEKEALKQTAANLLAGSPGAETVEIDLSGLPSGNPAAFLWVYVTLEDYTDHWEMYDAKERRLYAIEGSAMLVGGSATATFALAVDADDSPVVLHATGGSSPTWLEPLTAVKVGTEPPEVPTGQAVIETFFSSEQTDTVELSNTIQVTLQLSGNVSGTYPATISFTGRRVTGVTVNGVALSGSDGEWSKTWSNGLVQYSARTYYINFNGSADSEIVKVAYKIELIGTSQSGPSSSTRTMSWADSPDYRVRRTDRWYVMLKLANGVPYDADRCSDTTEASRMSDSAEITGSASPWTVNLNGESYVVTKTGTAVTMTKDGYLIGSWSSSYDGASDFFDASVAIYLPGEDANDRVVKYGLAATVGDFSHVVATFEAGLQPSHAEVLGRLARMSRADSGGMAYLHPATAALADEIDVLRPVPRFVRADSLPLQSSCQPGLSVWYWRPGVSAAAPGLAFKGAAVATVVVSAPAFLQLALMAVRSPRAFGRRIVLTNADGAEVSNGFALRFVAWKSPANQWDGSNSFAMAAMASVPSVYRSDGPDKLSWTVDCSGSLMPLGSRTVTAERLGVSQTVSGAIADGTTIEIPIVSPVGEGDVVIIAPEVLGFADGTGSASVVFARQADPAETTPAEEGQPENAANHNHAWARYPENLGWFPRVTGE